MTIRLTGWESVAAHSALAKNSDTEDPPKGLVTKLLGNEPIYCECAYVAKRPLSWSRWIPGLSKILSGGILDSLNKEWAHEHLIFEQSKSNIGFGPQGLFSENIQEQEYLLDSVCLNGSLMRQAIEDTKPPSFYLFFFQNCQTYVESVLDRYHSLYQTRLGVTEKCSLVPNESSDTRPVQRLISGR